MKMATKRNFEDLLPKILPLGTQWDWKDDLYKFKWNFSNLEQALEEGGELHNKKVYLFGLTKPEFVPYKGESRFLVWVPVVVAVVSPDPPSNKIGVSRGLTVEIVPMQQMKLDWVPYIPLECRESQVEKPKDSQIFILTCSEGRADLRHLETDRLKQLQNCIPHLHNPFQYGELDQRTVVELVLCRDPNPVVAMFDFKHVDIEKFTTRLIARGELPADKKEHFINHAREKILKAEIPSHEARESLEKAWDKLKQKSKAAFVKIDMQPKFGSELWDPSDIEKFTDKLIEEEELPKDEKELLMNYIREAAKSNRELREYRKEAQEKSKAVFKDMEFYKFYPVPTSDTPDVSRVKFPYINRYYGNAHKVI